MATAVPDDPVRATLNSAPIPESPDLEAAALAVRMARSVSRRHALRFDFHPAALAADDADLRLFGEGSDRGRIGVGLGLDVDLADGEAGILRECRRGKAGRKGNEEGETAPGHGFTAVARARGSNSSTS